MIARDPRSCELIHDDASWKHQSAVQVDSATFTHGRHMGFTHSRNKRVTWHFAFRHVHNLRAHTCATTCIPHLA